MKEQYNINELALMSGFTTRTLRNYLTQGILKGKKVDGAWQFSIEDIDSFFSEPFVREGMRIKRNNIVYDFLADRSKKEGKTCVILDLPMSVKAGNELSSFFCEQMNDAADVVFNYEYGKGKCRVILSGAESEVEKIMKTYYARTAESTTD